MAHNMDGVRQQGSILVLPAFLALCLAVSAIGGSVTAISVGTWYPTLVKPFFSPPNWVFAPVWITLYLMIAVSGWLAWRQKTAAGRSQALMVYGVQLALNLLWSFLFFGLQRIDLGMIDIVLLLAAIVLNVRLFWRVDKWAGALLVPYLAWVSFATLLNGSLLWLNA